jgi:hypothetical protein
MRQDIQPYEQKRRVPTLVLGLVLCLPLLVVMEIDDSAWRRAAPPISVSAALIGVGVGLYTLMFLTLFYRLPRWIKAHVGEDVARRWQYAALVAGLATGAITVGATVQKLPIEPYGLAMGLAMLAVVVAYTMLAWLMVRHFPEACNWIPFRHRGFKNWTGAGAPPAPQPTKEPDHQRR